jgi:hypothetical protein
VSEHRLFASAVGINVAVALATGVLVVYRMVTSGVRVLITDVLPTILFVGWLVTPPGILAVIAYAGKKSVGASATVVTLSVLSGGFGLYALTRTLWMRDAQAGIGLIAIPCIQFFAVLVAAIVTAIILSGARRG